MVEKGDNLIFPTIDNSTRGDTYVSKTVDEFEHREDGGEGLFESIVGEDEDYVVFEDGDEVPFSEIGQKRMGAEVTEDDVFVEPADSDPQPIGEASVELQRDRTQPQPQTQSTTTQRGRAWSDLGFDDPSPPADGLEGANIGRYENTGTFADEPPVVATEANQLRNPHTGEFLGQEVEATDPRVDRDPETGRFEKERSGRESLGVLDGDLFF